MVDTAHDEVSSPYRALDSKIDAVLVQIGGLQKSSSDTTVQLTRVVTQLESRDREYVQQRVTFTEDIRRLEHALEQERTERREADAKEERDRREAVTNESKDRMEDIKTTRGTLSKISLLALGALMSIAGTAFAVWVGH